MVVDEGGDNFTSIFLKEWKYGDGKKNGVRDFADSDCTTLKP